MSAADEVAELEKIHKLNSPEGAMPQHFYLQIGPYAPVGYKIFRNMRHWLDLKPVEGRNYENARETLAQKLGVSVFDIEAVIYD